MQIPRRFHLSIVSLSTDLNNMLAQLSYLCVRNIIAVASVLCLAVMTFAKVLRNRNVSHKMDVYKTAYLLLCLFTVHPVVLCLGYVGYFTPHHPKMVQWLIALCEFQIGREMASLACEYLNRKRDMQMVVHHFGFIIAAAVSPIAYFNGALSYRAIFFFGGVSETSTVLFTIKLLFQELVHKPYTPRVQRTYNGIRYTFFALFVVFRLVWWNVHTLEGLCTAHRLPWRLATAVYVTLLTLTAMQLQWGWLMTKIAYCEWSHLAHVGMKQVHKVVDGANGQPKQQSNNRNHTKGDLLAFELHANANNVKYKDE